MNFEENDLEEYNKYMDFIFQHIIDESRTKFKLTVKREQIELGHIRKDDESKKWVFYYTLTNDYKSQFEIWRGSNKRSCMTIQIGYDDWKLLLIKENRDNRITELLSGLEPIHKQLLLYRLINN